ncbi:MAG TPA: ROK family transcriptional regulator, partial [Deinococcales bacterium]|nr:ROK family transcriptional regulator [Deinococcales bacterium]
MRTLKGDQSTVRALNRRLILNTIRQSGPLSRSQLAERTGLSPAAVTGVTAELIADGYLLEGSLGEAVVGRPPILLDLNVSAFYAVGLKLMEDRIEAVLTDLATTVVERATLTLPDHTPESVAATAARAVDHFMTGGRDRARLIGTGLGMPGVIDADSGTCRQSPILGWRDVPIGRMISEATGAPAWVDNDVNAFATAERLFGRGRNAQSFLTVTFGRGIGAGLVLDGRVYRGTFGGAGEFGHTTSEPGGRQCECGKHGCLEAYASEPALAARLAEHSGLPNGGIEGFLAATSTGDPTALELQDDAARRAGIRLADLVNVLNPELVVIGGEGVRLGERFFEILRDSLAEHAFDGLADQLPFFVDEWGDDAWARGAASLAVQQAFALTGGQD